MSNRIQYGITCKVVRVTVAMAKRWLETGNIKNRTVNRCAVAEYIGLLRRGLFFLTHQGIAFDRNGYLMDGQHRLLAIIASGIEVDMLVFTYDIDMIQKDGTLHPIMMVFDKGRVRTVSQNLQLNGIKNSTLIAAICNVIRFTLVESSGAKSTERVIQGVHDTYLKSIEAIMGAGWHPKERMAPLLGVLVMFHASHPDEAMELAKKIATQEGLRSKSAELTMSKFARHTLRQMTGHAQRTEAVNRMINGCMKYLHGQRIEQLCASESAMQWMLDANKKQADFLRANFCG